MNEFTLTTSEIAVRIGKSVAYVSNSMRLLMLPDALKDGLLSGLISEGHARALSSIDDPSLIIEAYKQVLRESASVRRAEELARRMKAKSNQAIKPKTRTDDLRIVSEEMDKMQAELERALRFSEDESKDKTEVKLSQSKKQTKVVFTFRGSAEENDAKLRKIYASLTN